MWTPRRVLLLVVGFVACATTFGVYFRFLGWIDGLPALPEKYLATAVKFLDIDIDVRVDEPKMQKLLKQAFGDRCPELSYPIKSHVRGEEVLLATDQVVIETDGRLKLSPFSVAVFKQRPDVGF